MLTIGDRTDYKLSKRALTESANRINAGPKRCAELAGTAGPGGEWGCSPAGHVVACCGMLQAGVKTGIDGTLQISRAKTQKIQKERRTLRTPVRFL